MALRLNLYAQHIAQIPQKTTPKIVNSAFDYLSLADYLSPEQNSIRLQIRSLVQTQINPKICTFVQSATFPQFVLPLLKRVKILEHFASQPQKKESRHMLRGVVIAEMARGDAGLATLLVNTIQFIDILKQLGSKDQQANLIPKLLDFQVTASCGLLENAESSQLSLQATLKQKSLVLNGKSRLHVANPESIGCLWTKSGENHMRGFVFEKNKWPAAKITNESNRFGLRILASQTIQFQEVKVDECHHLSNLLDLSTSILPVRLRLWICWMVAGICIGVYDNTIKYASQRTQFNRPIAGFQLIQQKIVKLMSTTQAVILTCVRLSHLIEAGELSYLQAGLAKGWICERARQVSRLGRQIYGGNGILSQNYSMRALADLQTIYSFTGSNESGLVAAGRQLLMRG